LHTLNTGSSTIAAWHEDLITAGACGYAAVEWAVYAVNRVNAAETLLPQTCLAGAGRTEFLSSGTKRLGRKIG